MVIFLCRVCLQTQPMNQIQQIAVLALILLGTYTPAILGDSFRCGRKLISTGDSSGELLRICGEPYHKDRGRAEVDVNGVGRAVSVERWYYKKNRRSLEHVIIVYKGNVEAVVVGNR
jgi:hypothetical protein